MLKVRQPCNRGISGRVIKGVWGSICGLYLAAGYCYLWCQRVNTIIENLMFTDDILSGRLPLRIHLSKAASFLDITKFNFLSLATCRVEMIKDHTCISKMLIHFPHLYDVFHVPGLCLLGIGGAPYISHKIMAQKLNFHIFDFFSESTSR